MSIDFELLASECDHEAALLEKEAKRNEDADAARALLIAQRWRGLATAIRDAVLLRTIAASSPPARFIN